MGFVWKRRWYLQLGCILTLNMVYASLDYQKETPPSLGQIDHQCWEVSSHGLVEMKKLKVADTVIALWDFMMFLKESPKPKHNELFNDLAQNFWDMVCFHQPILGHKGEKMKIPQRGNISMKEHESTADGYWRLSDKLVGMVQYFSSQHEVLNHC